MLDALGRRLTALIITVFLVLFSFFAVAVYWWVSHQLEVEDKKNLQTFSRTISTSIEPPDEEAREHAFTDREGKIPDVLEQHGPVVNQQSLGLQWYSDDGTLLASKGGIKLNLPLSVTAGFETQKEPHAILLTEPVFRKGKLVGYVRTGMSMEFTDRARERLRNGLVFALLSSLGLTALATWLIVKEALKCARNVIEKLSQFTADASHELKSPITAIKMNADVLAQYSQLEPQEKQLISSISDAAQQMNRTVQDLLLLARVEAIEPQVEERSTLGVLLTEVLAELSIFAEQKNIQIVPHVENPDLKVSVSDVDVKRVLSNVVKNAIQYSPSESKVMVFLKAHKSLVQIEVQDFGVGIGPEDQTRIFDRFWRADKARSGTTGANAANIATGSTGSGLGLSIAQTIVQKYKGSLSVTSEPGQGSTFKILLPLA
ncbi:MAG: HAMP domain-containing histidine kinase [Cyanobacteria bacterium SZAS LIN-5]|nr:HAMP domain-containing histidine kinase [Cyanobacteria bacterium SZAS LIN-5]